MNIFLDNSFFISRHWDEFYSQADLQELYDSGITHIRLPIGYWLVDVSPDEPFPPPPQSDDEGLRLSQVYFHSTFDCQVSKLRFSDSMFCACFNGAIKLELES